MKTIAYGRVSTEKQDEESQKNMIARYASEQGYKVDSWIFETISSRKAVCERQLEDILCTLGKGDRLIVSESSRLARGGMIELASIIQRIKDRKARLSIVIGIGGEPMEIDSTAKMDFKNEMKIAMVGWGANMERQNISERTKNALQARKEKGVKLGRPKGTKLPDHAEKEVRKLLEHKVTLSAIARVIGISRGRLYRWVRGHV